MEMENMLNEINQQSDEVLIKLLQQFPYAIRFIENPSIEVQQIAVTECPNIIKEIKNPDESVQALAVTLDPDSIQYITNPTELVQRVTVCDNPFAIRFIKNPSRHIQHVAANTSPEAVLVMKTVDEELAKSVTRKASWLEKYYDASTLRFNDITGMRKIEAKKIRDLYNPKRMKEIRARDAQRGLKDLDISYKILSGIKNMNGDVIMNEKEMKDKALFNGTVIGNIFNMVNNNVSETSKLNKIYDKLISAKSNLAISNIPENKTLEVQVFKGTHDDGNITSLIEVKDGNTVYLVDAKIWEANGNGGIVDSYLEVLDNGFNIVNEEIDDVWSYINVEPDSQYNNHKKEF